MMLDGKAGKVYEEDLKGDVHLDKTADRNFEDEWDFVIDNYLVGGNDPDIIDSIASLRTVPFQQQTETETVQTQTPVAPVVIEQPVQKTGPPKEEPKPVVKVIEPVKPLTIEEKAPSKSPPFGGDFEDSNNRREIYYP